jgi:hypothetical protein
MVSGPATQFLAMPRVKTSKVVRKLVLQKSCTNYNFKKHTPWCRAPAALIAVSTALLCSPAYRDGLPTAIDDYDEVEVQCQVNQIIFVYLTTTQRSMSKPSCL